MGGVGEWVVWVYKPILVLSFSSSLTKIKCEQWTKVKGLMSVFPFPVCVYAVIHYHKVRVKQTSTTKVVYARAGNGRDFLQVPCPTPIYI